MSKLLGIRAWSIYLVNKEFRLDRIIDLIFNADRLKGQYSLLPSVFIVKKEFASNFACPFIIENKALAITGDTLYNVKVHSYFRAHRMLMEYLDNITVIEPKEFRDDYLDTLKRMVKQYE